MADSMRETTPPPSKTIQSDEVSTPSENILISHQEVRAALATKEIVQTIPAAPQRTDTSDTISTINSSISVDSEATDITVPDGAPAEEIKEKGAAARQSVERSNFYANIPKEEDRPVPRRHRSMLDRNAMANPGASLWDPNK